MMMPRSTAFSHRLARLLLATAVFLCAGCDNAQGGARDLEDDAAQPVRGGTLKIVGSSDADHLWAASATSWIGFALVSAFSRQLFAQPSSTDYATATQVAPDLATELPTQANGGISADGRTYVIRMRRDAMWNSTPPRRVTARDIERAFKLLCNPVSPPAAPQYYQATIAGLEGYCSALRRTATTVAAIRQFVSSHDIEGVRALDELTVEFKLLAPASDFLNLLALTFASPVPEEYLDYLPDSPEFRQHTLSNGPYVIASYKPGRRYELVRNPVWDPASDPLRPAYVDRITLQLAVDPAVAQLQVEAGTTDLAAMVMLTPDLASLRARADARAMLMPAGEHFTAMYGLLVNMVSPGNRRALQQLPVRRALALAVDRQALVQLSGGAEVARPLYQAVPSTASGFRSGGDRDVTPGDRGDPAAARRLLREAGFPDGMPLRLVYQNQSLYPIQAQSLQASFRRAGLDVRLAPYTAEVLLGQFLPDSSHANRGDWDLSLGVFNADWYGSNNGRSVITFFDGRWFGRGGIIDFGGYNSPTVNAAIDRALVAPSIEEAEHAWIQAATQVMADVAIVPLIETKDAHMRGARVRNCLWAVRTFQCDWNSVWLSDTPTTKPARRS